MFGEESSGEVIDWGGGRQRILNFRSPETQFTEYFFKIQDAQINLIFLFPNHLSMQHWGGGGGGGRKLPPCPLPLDRTLINNLHFLPLQREIELLLFVGVSLKTRAPRALCER